MAQRAGEDEDRHHWTVRIRDALLLFLIMARQRSVVDSDRLIADPTKVRSPWVLIEDGPKGLGFCQVIRPILSSNLILVFEAIACCLLGENRPRYVLPGYLSRMSLIRAGDSTAENKPNMCSPGAWLNKGVKCLGDTRPPLGSYAQPT